MQGGVIKPDADSCGYSELGVEFRHVPDAEWEPRQLWRHDERSSRGGYYNNNTTTI